MRPIPRAWLIHTATLLQPALDAYQKETLTPVAVLSQVRVEKTDALARTADDTRPTRAALLLYDARNSRPRGVVFTAGQTVCCGDTLYFVESVECLSDGRRPHHTEVSLTL